MFLRIKHSLINSRLFALMDGRIEVFIGVFFLLLYHLFSEWIDPLFPLLNLWLDVYCPLSLGCVEQPTPHWVESLLFGPAGRLLLQLCNAWFLKSTKTCLSRAERQRRRREGAGDRARNVERYFWSRKGFGEVWVIFLSCGWIRFLWFPHG